MSPVPLSHHDEQERGRRQSLWLTSETPLGLQLPASRPPLWRSDHEHLNEGCHGPCSSPPCSVWGLPLVHRKEWPDQRVFLSGPLFHCPQAAPAKMPGSCGPGGPGLPSPPGQKPRLPSFRSRVRGSPTPSAENCSGRHGRQLAVASRLARGMWRLVEQVPALLFRDKAAGNLLGLFLGK